MLQAEMHEGRDTGIAQGLEQGLVHFDRINGRDAQLFQVRDQFQHPLHQIAELWLARQISAPGSQIDAGQHNFIMPGLDQTLDHADHIACRDRP